MIPGTWSRFFTVRVKFMKQTRVSDLDVLLSVGRFSILGFEFQLFFCWGWKIVSACVCWHPSCSCDYHLPQSVTLVGRNSDFSDPFNNFSCVFSGLQGLNSIALWNKNNILLCRLYISVLPDYYLCHAHVPILLSTCHITTTNFRVFCCNFIWQRNTTSV